MASLKLLLRRYSFGSLCRSAIPAPLSLSIVSGSVSVCARRHFWNPFGNRSNSGSGSSDTFSHSTAVQHERIVEMAHRDASLHNERLLDACLDMLRLCSARPYGEAGPLPAAEAERIAQLVESTLHDFRKTPAEQFDLVYAALCLPSAAHEPQLSRCLLVVLEAVLPEALFRVFESADLVVAGEGPEAVERRGALLRFVHTLLGGDSDSAPDGLESEEIVLVYLEDVQAAFPTLRGNAAFTELCRGATSIAMRAKLYALLSQLCAEFDRDNTGKVELSELRATAKRVLGEEQATMLLEGARPDAQGMIRYQQLTALLTRPPPRRRG